MVEIVNIVSSGALGVELNLEKLATDIGGPAARYDPGKYPGLYLRFEDNAPLITVYRTGKYIITGADSEEESCSLRERFFALLSNMGVIEQSADKWFSIQNYVCTGELGETQNLNALTIDLGLEKSEYEPEQFPGLIYRPDTRDCVVLIFATGKAVITGAKELETAKRAFEELRDTVAEFA